jgi:hypothetical protein
MKLLTPMNKKKSRISFFLSNYAFSLPKINTIMKKSLFLLFASFSFVAANAQIKNDRGTFTKPKAGAVIAEINFSPTLAGSNAAVFSLPTVVDGVVGIKVRKFVSDKKAYRILGNFQMTNESSGAGGEAQTSFALGAGFGIENHLKGAERLSTYWGYEGRLGLLSGTGILTATDFPGVDEETLAATKGTKFGFGANALAGFDYYFIPNVYLGAEISYGLAVSSSTPEDGDASTKISLAPGVTGTFRLGWRF